MAQADQCPVEKAITDSFSRGYPFVDCGLCQIYVKGGEQPTQEDILAFNAKHQDSPVPHLFSTVNKAYEQLQLTRRPQSILFTGHVGSGKTSNHNLAVQSVVRLAGSANSRLGDFILHSHKVLEALGNIVTVKSRNHSAFVQVGSNGRISGAFLETLLLDKSSLFSRNQGERTFHIIYQIFAGMDVHKKASLYLTQPDKFQYLQTGEVSLDGVDDFDRFLETKSALDELNFSEDEQDNIFRIIAAVLHLGNLKYVPNEEGIAEIENEEVLEDNVAVLLGVNGKELREAMLRPSRVLAGETFIRKLTPIQASKLRDNFAYALYDRVFRWVVDKINQIFKRAGEKNKEHKDAHLPALSILDIPGFSTDQGGFNAFCNNLLNEKLQQVYNSEIIGKRLEMVVEQIKSETVPYSLNGKPMIDSMTAILRTLDDHAWPKKLTDQQFKASLSSLLPTNDDTLKFTLNHFAGEATYDVSGWVSLNDSNSLEDNIENLLLHSSSDLVVDVCDTFRPPNPVDGEDYVSVSKELLTQLDGVFGHILNSQRHFVRCLKANKGGDEKDLDLDYIREQLDFFGVKAGYKLHQKFSSTIAFSAFGRKYGLGQDDHRKEWDRDNILKLIEDLNKTVLADVADSCVVGKSKVFVTEGALWKLERERKRHILEKVLVLQAATRGFICRQKLAKIQAGTILQSVIRRFHVMAQDHWVQLWMATTNLGKEKYEKQITAATSEQKDARQELSSVQNRNKALGSKIEDLKREVAMMQAQLAKTNADKAELLTNMSALVTENIRMTKEISKRLDKK